MIFNKDIKTGNKAPNFPLISQIQYPNSRVYFSLFLFPFLILNIYNFFPLFLLSFACYQQS